MKTYAVRATGGRDGQLGDKKIEDMKQDTGAARLASAMNVYEAIAQARAKDGFQTEPLSEARRQERVKETSFEEMYKEKFGDIQNESNRHRRAATYAQSEMKRTQAEQARQPEAPAHKKN